MSTEEVKKVTWADVKDKMVGLVPLTNNSSWEFTPSVYNDIPEEFRPTFKLKMYTIESSERIRKIISKTMNGKTVAKDDPDQQMMDELFTAFVGWENLYDLGSGELIKYNGTREMFDILPKSIIMKMFEESLVLAGILPRQVVKVMNGEE